MTATRSTETLTITRWRFLTVAFAAALPFGVAMPTFGDGM
jgi:hypothetical protein